MKDLAHLSHIRKHLGAHAAITDRNEVVEVNTDTIKTGINDGKGHVYAPEIKTGTRLLPIMPQKNIQLQAAQHKVVTPAIPSQGEPYLFPQTFDLYGFYQHIDHPNPQIVGAQEFSQSTTMNSYNHWGMTYNREMQYLDPTGNSNVWGITNSDYQQWILDEWPSAVLTIIATMVNVSYSVQTDWQSYVNTKLAAYPAYISDVYDAGFRYVNLGGPSTIRLEFLNMVPEGMIRSYMTGWSLLDLLSAGDAADLLDKIEEYWESINPPSTYPLSHGEYKYYEDVPDMSGWKYSMSRLYRLNSDVVSPIYTNLPDVKVVYLEQEQDYTEAEEWQNSVCVVDGSRLHYNISPKGGEVLVQIHLGYADDTYVIDNCEAESNVGTIPNESDATFGKKETFSITVNPFGIKITIADDNYGTYNNYVIFDGLLIKQFDMISSYMTEGESADWEDSPSVRFDYPNFPSGWPSEEAQEEYVEALKLLTFQHTFSKREHIRRWMTVSEDVSKHILHNNYALCHKAIRINFSVATSMPDAFDPFDFQNLIP